MNKNKGFTLIELLVVIAIIGILSSVVLASLSGARTKAKVAAVQSTLSSMRAQAEIGVINGKYISNICASTSNGGLGNLLASLADSKKSKIQSLACGVDVAGTTATDLPRKWAVEVKIDDKFYCTDSTGFSGPSKTTGLSSALDSGASLSLNSTTGIYTVATKTSISDLRCAD